LILSRGCNIPVFAPSLLIRSRSVFSWLAGFADLFTRPTWSNVLVLLAGVILAPGRRTVTAALRILGRDRDPDFCTFHPYPQPSRMVVAGGGRPAAAPTDQGLCAASIPGNRDPKAALTFSDAIAAVRREGPSDSFISEPRQDRVEIRCHIWDRMENALARAA
jgi:hypothetical protein